MAWPCRTKPASLESEHCLPTRFWPSAQELVTSADKAYPQVFLRSFPLPQTARTVDRNCRADDSTHYVSRCIGVELSLAGKRSKVDFVARMFAHVMQWFFVVIVPCFDTFNQPG